MPTSNEEILDRYIRHQTYLLRYAGGLRNQVLPELAATEKELFDTVLQWIAKADGNRTLTGASGRQWQKNYSDAIRDIRKPAWEKMSKEVSSQLKELAIAEAATTATLIEGALPVVVGMDLPPVSKLIAIVNSQPFEGRTLKGWMERTQQADLDKLLTASKIGIVQGHTPTQVARTIIGTKGANYTDGVARKAFRDVESVLLTITNGIQNEARQALYAANSDIVKEELYVATLDVRTTIECAGFDGQIFPRGQGPIPPIHFRCRSVRVPHFAYENLNSRPFDSRSQKELLQEYSEKSKLPRMKSRADLPRGHKGKFDEFSRSKGKEMIGQVPAKTTYNAWLKTQTKEFQNQVLGPTRAELFRKGKVSLDKFIARDGDVLTLAELSKVGI